MSSGRSGDGDAWPWPAPENDGAADHLRGGQRVPSVPLMATTGVALDLGKQPGSSVVFIYPFMGGPGRPNPPGWDDIPGAHGSTPQAEEFAHQHSSFTASGYAVFGLSAQPLSDQREAALRLGLPFQLLNDGDHAFKNAMRLPTFQVGDAMFLKRLTLVISNGSIDRVIYPVHPPNTHARDVLRKLGLSAE